MAEPLPDLGGWLARRSSSQLAAAMGVLAALALSGSLLVTGAAVRMDQREAAALAALDDYSAMVSKLGSEASLSAEVLTETDASWLSAWLSAFQSGPAHGVRTLEETCRTGRGGAGVRFISAPVGKPAGLAALGSTPGQRIDRFGEGVFAVRLDAGVLCPSRAVEVVVVRRPFGALDIAVGRVVDRPGQAWGWAVAAVIGAGALLLVIGLAAAAMARRRLTSAVAEVSRALDRAAVGDFSRRAPETSVAPELTELTGHVNLTLDRLDELLSWLRDSADQLAHDFRTPLARASVRLDKLHETVATPGAHQLIEEARSDLARITRSMNEAMALRDGEAWVFDSVRLDTLAVQAAELYQPLADERDVAIRVEGEPVSVLGVHSLLQRAVTNLVDNAVKFSPAGGVVTLIARRRNGRAVLIISDQGGGFSAAGQRESISGDGPESHGMGLTFVRAILKRHGASMTVDDGHPGAVVTAHFSR